MLTAFTIFTLLLLGGALAWLLITIRQERRDWDRKIAKLLEEKGKKAEGTEMEKKE